MSNISWNVSINIHKYFKKKDKISYQMTKKEKKKAIILHLVEDKSTTIYRTFILFKIIHF